MVDTTNTRQMSRTKDFIDYIHKIFTVAREATLFIHVTKEIWELFGTQMNIQSDVLSEDPHLMITEDEFEDVKKALKDDFQLAEVQYAQVLLVEIRKK